LRVEDFLKSIHGSLAQNMRGILKSQTLRSVALDVLVVLRLNAPRGRSP
jgi:hypothetical protein